MAQAPTEKPVPLGKYVVKGADIWTADGRKAEGAIVELPASEAKHFNKLGLLAPYIPGEELEG